MTREFVGILWTEHNTDVARYQASSSIGPIDSVWFYTLERLIRIRRARISTEGDRVPGLFASGKTRDEDRSGVSLGRSRPVQRTLQGAVGAIAARSSDLSQPGQIARKFCVERKREPVGEPDPNLVTLVEAPIW